jgi:hypothetical protein
MIFVKGEAMKLYGKNWDRATLLRYVGSIRQIGGATPSVLQEGPERGVRTIEVRTGTGFSFSILPDRGLDIFTAEFRGASLCWHSSTGLIAPQFFEPEGLGWLRGFYGGMVVTCGLTYAGPPTKDQGKDLGLHGRASFTPAYEVGITEGWVGDDYKIEIRGKIRETTVFGEHVVLTRKIRTALGENRFWIEDEVENLGYDETPHMLLYHVNGGFPLVDETAEMLSPSIEARPRDAEAQIEKEKWSTFLPPTVGFNERAYFHRLKAGADGKTTVALVNRRIGLGYALRYPLSQMPCLCEWKMMGAGTYVVGTEPGNVYPEARDLLRKEGRLPTLKPGEKRRYDIEFAALTSVDEIQRVEKEVRAL